MVITFVTTYGVVDGKHKSIVHSEVTMDDLFKSYEYYCYGSCAGERNTSRDSKAVFEFLLIDNFNGDVPSGRTERVSR